jgi:hypothetical protein
MKILIAITKYMVIAITTHAITASYITPMVCYTSLTKLWQGSKLAHFPEVTDNCGWQL